MTKACCHQPVQESHPHSHHHAPHHSSHHTATIRSNLRTAASATLHCLTGCAIGEFIGLALGVHLGWQPTHTMLMSTLLSFITGFALTLIPLMRHRGLRFAQAWKIVWIGEMVSITVMEIAMNLTDFRAGGMNVAGLHEPRFWFSFAIAMLAGFVAAVPVNAWLLSRNLKNCH